MTKKENHFKNPSNTALANMVLTHFDADNSAEDYAGALRAYDSSIDAVTFNLIRQAYRAGALWLALQLAKIAK